MVIHSQPHLNGRLVPGSIDSNGNWTLEALGTHRVDATSGGLTAWTNVTLVEGGVANLLMPQNLTVASGERIFGLT